MSIVNSLQIQFFCQKVLLLFMSIFLLQISMNPFLVLQQSNSLPSCNKTTNQLYPWCFVILLYVFCVYISNIHQVFQSHLKKFINKMIPKLPYPQLLTIDKVSEEIQNELHVWKRKFYKGRREEEKRGKHQRNKMHLTCLHFTKCTVLVEMHSNMRMWLEHWNNIVTHIINIMEQCVSMTGENYLFYSRTESPLLRCWLQE